MKIKISNPEEVYSFLSQEWNNFFKEKCLVNNQEKIYFLAKHKDRTIGAAVLKIRDFAAKLEELLIEKEYRGRGFGEMLINEVENKARERGCQKMVLETFDIHKESLKFYQERGYDIIAEIPKLYHQVRWYILIKNLY